MCVASSMVSSSQGGHDPGTSGRFHTTHWSLVVAAGRPETPESRDALKSLCEIYWYPLYVYVRRRVPDVHEVERGSPSTKFFYRPRMSLFREPC